MKINKKRYGRKEFTNSFYVGKNRTSNTEIPMIMDTFLTVNLGYVILPNR